MDDEERIWMANYPIGITIQNNRYPSYKWIKHSVGNKQSLINDQVNSIIEDSEGDLWYGTPTTELACKTQKPENGARF